MGLDAATSTDAPRPRISAIVVTYNTCAMTTKCLESLEKALVGIPAEMFVVDNASTDGSAQTIRIRFPHARLIENASNRGFGAANNQAMAQARGEFLLLLNSDAFPQPCAIAALLEYLQNHS